MNGTFTLNATRRAINRRPHTAVGIAEDIDATAVASLQHLPVNAMYARTIESTVVVTVASKASAKEFTKLLKTLRITGSPENIVCPSYL